MPRLGTMKMKRRVKILLIEPNRYHARLMAKEIEKSFPDARLAMFSNAHTALQEIRSAPADIVIVELELPDADGYGFLELLRKEYPRLPLIAVGKNDTEEDIAAAERHGADEYLSRRRSSTASLGETIRKLLSRPYLEENDDELHRQADLIRITAGTIYHEVNNPLMTILGLTELILNNGYEFDREVAKKVRIIQKSARRIQSALTKLSTISKPTLKETASGKMIDSEKSQLLTKIGI